MEGLDEMGQTDGCFIYHAGTKLDENGKLVTSGGRVIGVTATGNTLLTAIANAYRGVEKVGFKHAHYREDIGQRALKALTSEV